MKKRPLEGIKILDFSQVLSAPFCGMLLADMGAEIIKVERPGNGDISREYGPYKNDISPVSYTHLYTDLAADLCRRPAAALFPRVSDSLYCRQPHWKAC